MKDIVIAVISVIGGAVIGYIISYNLSLREKKREIIINYLIEAYKSIETSVHRNHLPDEMENSIGIIQLFGTHRQIKLAVEFSHTLANKKIAEADELLNDLRNHLRKELKLKKVKMRVVHLRIKGGKSE